MEFFVDLGNECAKMELLGELPGIEIPHGRCLNFGRIDLRVGDRFPARFDNDVAQGFAFFFEVSLKISSAGAEDVNWFVHSCSEPKLHAPRCHPEPRP